MPPPIHKSGAASSLRERRIRIAAALNSFIDGLPC
jgi:hypothetical protein